MSTDSQIEADLRALAAASARGLPTIDQTARVVADARAKRKGASIMSLMRKPLWATGLAVAVIAAVLVCPMPYTRTVGYVVKKSKGVVTVVPRRERVWGTVWAAVKQKLLTIHVDTAGKSDAEVADEIRAQLAAGGWNASEVQVQRGDDASSVEISADDGNGRHMKIVRNAAGGSEKSMDFQLGGLDDTREPGMSDAQLRDKILEQLKARGLDGDVIVDGNRVEIRAKKTIDSDD